MLCAGGASAAVRPEVVSGAGRLGPVEGDGAEDEGPELPEEGEPDVVAGLLTGAGPEGAAGAAGVAGTAGTAGGAGRDEGPEPDGATGGT